MGQNPSDIRAEIEETRARVGDEVDALSYKTDVPARMGDYVDDKKQAVKDKVSGVKDAIVGTTSDAVQTTSDALAERRAARQVEGHSRTQPPRPRDRRGRHRFRCRTPSPIDPARGQADGRDVRQGDRRRQGHSKRCPRERQADRCRCGGHGQGAGTRACFQPSRPGPGITRKFPSQLSTRLVVPGSLRPRHNHAMLTRADTKEATCRIQAPQNTMKQS